MLVLKKIVKISKKKNINSICSELPKIAILSKNAVQALGVKVSLIEKSICIFFVDSGLNFS